MKTLAEINGEKVKAALATLDAEVRAAAKKDGLEVLSLTPIPMQRFSGAWCWAWRAELADGACEIGLSLGRKDFCILRRLDAPEGSTT